MPSLFLKWKITHSNWAVFFAVLNECAKTALSLIIHQLWKLLVWTFRTNLFGIFGHHWNFWEIVFYLNAMCFVSIKFTFFRLFLVFIDPNELGQWIFEQMRSKFLEFEIFFKGNYAWMNKFFLWNFNLSKQFLEIVIYVWTLFDFWTLYFYWILKG